VEQTLWPQAETHTMSGIGQNDALVSARTTPNRPHAPNKHSGLGLALCGVPPPTHTQTSSDEESEAEVGGEEEESDDEFCDRTKAPVPN
jgi:hypothetical protein